MDQDVGDGRLASGRALAGGFARCQGPGSWPASCWSKFAGVKSGPEKGGDHWFGLFPPPPTTPVVFTRAGEGKISEKGAGR